MNRCVPLRGKKATSACRRKDGHLLRPKEGQPMTQAVIESIAAFLPERVVGNEELARTISRWSAADIFQKTGIRERRFASPGECSSDLAVGAARKLMEEGRMNPAEIDYVIFCTQSADYALPASACLIQDRLGLHTTCGASDVNQGCSGYVTGLSLSKGLIVSRQARCVLLLTGETYSKYINPRDAAVATLFGDAGTATVIRAREETDAGIGEFVFGTDGRGGKNLVVPAGGMRKPRTPQTAQETTDSDGNTRSENDLYMNGRDVFRFAISEVPRTYRSLLAKTGLAPEQLDYLILHQANKYMLDQLVRRLELPKEKIPYEFEDIGNTVSNTIPIVLERLLKRDTLHPGQQLMLIGFGVGYSWAACTVRWA